MNWQLYFNNVDDKYVLSLTTDDYWLNIDVSFDYITQKNNIEIWVYPYSWWRMKDDISWTTKVILMNEIISFLADASKSYSLDFKNTKKLITNILPHMCSKTMNFTNNIFVR